MKSLAYLLVAALVSAEPLPPNAVVVLVYGIPDAPMADEVAPVGSVVEVPVLVDSLTADPEGVASITFALRYNATMLTPDLVLGPGSFPATYSAVHDGPRDSTDLIQRRLTATVTFDPPLTAEAANAHGGALCVFRFTVKGRGTPQSGMEPGTATFAMDNVLVNADPEFETTGQTDNKLVVPPSGSMKYRVTVETG